MKPSLHAQTQAVDTMATQARQRGGLKFKPNQWEMLEPRLTAAALTMLTLQVWRDKLPPEFIAQIERES